MLWWKEEEKDLGREKGLSRLLASASHKIDESVW